MTVEDTKPSTESLTRRVLETVAAREGVTTTDLTTPLYEVVDPEALDALFTAGVGHVVFPYYGYRITVYGDGRVETVEEADP
jgi:hypothetical protein